MSIGTLSATGKNNTGGGSGNIYKYKAVFTIPNTNVILYSYAVITTVEEITSFQDLKNYVKKYGAKYESNGKYTYICQCVEFTYITTVSTTTEVENLIECTNEYGNTERLQIGSSSSDSLVVTNVTLSRMEV